MKDINKLKNYREKYKRHYGIEFGKEYAIHHIDGNRENNDISNLLLLPAELHSKYHTYRTMFELTLAQVIGNSFCLDLSYAGCCSRDWQLSELDKFRSVAKECREWVERKYLADNGYDVYSGFARRKNKLNEVERNV